MELNEAEEILSLAALAESGVKVEFLIKPKRHEVFVYFEPKSVDTTELFVILQIVEYKDGLPVASSYYTHDSPSSALEWLSDFPQREFEGGDVAPDFPDFLNRTFRASEHDVFEAAFAKVKWEVS